jgi:hypothetical protein
VAHDVQVGQGVLVGNTGAVTPGAQFGVQPPTSTTTFFTSSAVGNDPAVFWHQTSTGNVYRFDSNPGGATALLAHAMPNLPNVFSVGTAAVTANDGSAGMMFFGYGRAPVGGAPSYYSYVSGPSFVVIQDLALNTSGWVAQANGGYGGLNMDWARYQEGLTWVYQSSTIGTEVVFLPNTAFESDGVTPRFAYSFNIDGAASSSVDPANAVNGGGFIPSTGAVAIQNMTSANLFLANDGGDSPGDIGREFYMVSEDGSQAIGFDLNKNGPLVTDSQAVNLYNIRDQGFNTQIQALRVTDAAGNDLGTEMVLFVPGDGRVEIFDVNPSANGQFARGFDTSGQSQGGRNAWHITFARPGDPPITNGDGGLIFVANFAASDAAPEDSQVGYYRRPQGSPPSVEKITLNAAASARPYLYAVNTFPTHNTAIALNANFTDPTSAVGNVGRELAILQNNGGLLVFDINPGPGGSFPAFVSTTSTFDAVAANISGSAGTSFPAAINRELAVIEKATGNIHRFDLFVGSSGSFPSASGVRGANLLVRGLLTDDVGNPLGNELVVLDGLTFQAQKFDLNTGPDGSSPTAIGSAAVTLGGVAYDFFRVTITASAQLTAIGQDGAIGQEVAALDGIRGLSALLDGGAGSTFIGFNVRNTDGARLTNNTATVSNGGNTVTFFAAPIAASWGPGGSLPADPTIQVSFSASAVAQAMYDQNSPFFTAGFDSTTRSLSTGGVVSVDFVGLSDPNGHNPYVFVSGQPLVGSATSGVVEAGRAGDGVVLTLANLIGLGLAESGASVEVVVTALDGRDQRVGLGVNQNWDLLHDSVAVTVQHTNTNPAVGAVTQSGAPLTPGALVELVPGESLQLAGSFSDPDLAGNSAGADFERLTWDVTSGGISLAGGAQLIGGSTMSGLFTLTSDYATLSGLLGSPGPHPVVLTVSDAAGVAADTFTFDLRLGALDPCDVAGGAPDVDNNGVGDECYPPPVGCAWDGCAPLATPSSGDPSVNACVCAAEPSCCTAAWSEQCVRYAMQACGLVCPTAPACCAGVHPGSGCGGAVCEACVCETDAACCSVTWDAECDALATGSCIDACGCYGGNPPVCQAGGDLTGNGAVNVADAMCAVLTSLAASAQGAPPSCLAGLTQSLDTNCDCAADVTDVLLVVHLALFQGLPLAVDAGGDGCADACQL